MANMSYCRFENTLTDLRDCQEALEDFINNDENVISSDEERRKAKELIDVCRQIADAFDESDIDRQSERFDEEEEEEEEEE